MLNKFKRFFKYVLHFNENYYPMNENQINEGIEVCLSNTRRLNDVAANLLDAHTDICFCLWSLAVEEFGKFYFLKEAKSGNKEKSFKIPLWVFKNHDKRFRKGIVELEKFGGNIELYRRIIVSSNIKTNSATLCHSRSQNIISVPSFCTGSFEETYLIKPHLSYKIRLEMLYVDWDEKQSMWLMPEKLDNVTNDITARFGFDKRDMKKVIRILSDAIIEESSKISCQRKT